MRASSLTGGSLSTLVIFMETPERLTPATTRALLEQLGHHPIRRWGQNFLVDPNIVAKSLALAGVSPGDTVVEVGPGLGCLSRALIQAGAHVYAVEIDKKLASYLRLTFLKEARFHLLEDDAIDAPAANKPSDGKPWKVIANLPYAISTPWLETVLRRDDLPTSFTLMLQKEAALRFTAEPGSKHYGAISIFLNTLYESAGQHAVARQCFYPVPGVDSLLLHLRRRPASTSLAPASRSAIRALFTQRRKQIGSLMREHLPETVRAPWLEALRTQGFSERTRPEKLPLPCWNALDTLMRELPEANAPEGSP